MAKNVNIDICRLGVGHALILSNLPKAVQLTQLNKIIQSESTADLASFGLFEASSPNYTTYYPDVKAEDLVPKEEEFINPVFRALSEVIVHKKYNPIDFGHKEVLRNSMKLLQGQTVNVDHETMTGNAIGAVSEVSWEESYKVGDIIIPAGINSVLHIDGKSNPRIARGINSNPPSIHSTSVTVEFEWEQSHPKLTRDEFFSKLGTFDEKGEMIRRLVTKIKRYHEISVVNHGADPFAQLVKKDGKINNPKYAHIAYNSAVEERLVGSSFFMDFKNLLDPDVSDIIMNSIGNSTIPNLDNDNNNTHKNSESMKELLEALAAELGQSITLSDDGTLSKEQSDSLLSKFKADIAQAKTDKTDLAAEKKAHEELKTKHAALEAGSKDAAALQTFKDNRITQLREKAINTYKLSAGDKVDQTILDSINAMQDFEALNVMLKTYEASLDEKAPLKCCKCGSKEVSRASASSKEKEEGGEGEGSFDIGDEETMQKLIAKPKLPGFMTGE